MSCVSLTIMKIVDKKTTLQLRFFCGMRRPTDFSDVIREKRPFDLKLKLLFAIRKLKNSNRFMSS